MRAILLAGLALFCVRAHAGCSDVDLRPLLGAPMHQGDSSYCFAHTSATLIEARTGFRASPMALAAGYILTNPQDLPHASGIVAEKLTSEFVAQWRHDRNVEPQNLTPDHILTMDGLLGTGGDEEPTILMTNFQGLCAEARLPTGKNVYKRYLKSILAFHSKRRALFNGPIGEVTDPDSRSKARSFLDWIDLRCGQRTSLAGALVADSVSLAHNLKEFRRRQSLQLATSLAAGQHRVMDAVNRQLDRGNPVAVGYAIADVMPGEALEADGSTPRPEDHASVFAGRRSVGGRCYYYLRNSFGDDKDDYAPQFKGRVENGGVWVLPEEIPSLYSAVWIR